MAKYGKHRGKKAPSFVMLRHDMMESPAWLSLSLKARCTWLEIARRYNGSNNGNIPLSCRELCDLLKISKTSATRAFDELIGKGFVRVAQESSFTMKTKLARRWTLTHESTNNKPSTNDWRKWSEQ